MAWFHSCIISLFILDVFALDCKFGKLDLTALADATDPNNGNPLDCIFENNPDYGTQASFCQNSIECGGGPGGEGMVLQLRTTDNRCAAPLAYWDDKQTKPYQTIKQKYISHQLKKIRKCIQS
eukprot:871316_1